MEAVVVCVLLAVATLLLLTEWVRGDVVALGVMASLMLLGILEPADALSGFSNPATVTVAAMFVLSAGLQASGAVEVVGDRLLVHGPTRPLTLLLLMAAVIAPISAFINNTAVVAVFLPIVLRACQGHGISPSRLMMPLSFFAMIGGTCTLIGTSTNLIVSAAAVEHGFTPFRMFEFTRLGVVLLVAGLAFLLLVGRRLVPERVPAEGTAPSFTLEGYLSELVVLPGSPLIGRSIPETELGSRHDVEVCGHSREGRLLTPPEGHGSLAAGDLLLVRAGAKALLGLEEGLGLAVKPGRHPAVAELRASDAVLLEAVIPPTSDLEGRTIKGVDFRARFGGTALALRRPGSDLVEKLGRVRLRVGDELLIVAPRRRLEGLERESSFVVLGERDLPRLNPWRAAGAAAITAAVVLVASLGVYPIVHAAVAGAVLMVASGCLPARRAYDGVDWSVIFLLAGLIPLGMALERSGAAAAAVEILLGATGEAGPPVVLSLFFLGASLLTGFLSNNATAVLLVPLALTCAATLSVSPRPFLIALTFAASAAFWTPIGYQTNLLVYGPGGYRWLDFVRMGGPLTLIYWLLASLLIPVLFPF